MNYNIPNSIKDAYPNPLISGLIQLFEDSKITLADRVDDDERMLPRSELPQL